MSDRKIVKRKMTRTPGISNTTLVAVVGCLTIIVIAVIILTWAVLSDVDIMQQKSVTTTISDLELADRVEIVVARYNENVNWFGNDIVNGIPITCYNKGINNLNIQKLSGKRLAPIDVINLHNVGRCGHTYLYHIVHNYHRLADLTVFLPGSCMDTRKIHTTHQLMDYIRYTGAKNTVLIGDVMNNVRNALYNFKLDEYISSNSQNVEFNSESKLSHASIRPFGAWFDHYFPEYPPIHVVCYSEIFAVHRKHITQHPIEYYIKLMETLDHHSNPEAGHYMERSWGAIFYPYPMDCLILSQR